MLKRIILDTNALLNAVFVPRSWSRLVLHKLTEINSKIFIGDESLAEAFVVARRITVRIEASKDIVPVIERFVRDWHMERVTPTTQLIEEKVPKHDHHIAREAATACATILTSDAGLWIGCNQVGRKAVLPLQALRLLDGYSVSTTIFGIAPSSQRGSIFARLFPGGWAGARGVGRFTVVDFPDALWLYYCTDRQAWVAEFSGLPPISYPSEITHREMQTIALSWSENGVVFRGSSFNAQCKINMTLPSSLDFSTNICVGRNIAETDFFNGSIFSLVMNDAPISAKIWQKLCVPSELTPNPFDSDRLQQAVDELYQQRNWPEDQSGAESELSRP